MVTSLIKENSDVHDPLTDSENKRLCLLRDLLRAVQFTQSAYKCHKHFERWLLDEAGYFLPERVI